jgi:glycosyltransferase involved in cell wall biosynthesis
MSSVFTSLDDLMKEAGLVLPSGSSVEQLVQMTSPSKVASKKRKFMLVGTHAHQTTGYSKVTYNIIKELHKMNKFELYHFGFQKFLGSPMEYRTYPPDVDVYDAVTEERDGKAEKEMGFGFSQLVPYIRKVLPDVILIYNDAGVICQFLEKMKELTAEEKSKYKLIIYLDQVYTTQRPEYLRRMDEDATAYFTFTDFWRSTLMQQGIKKPIYVLRHGFDADVFKPSDRITLRKKHNIPENILLFLNLNRNTPRKRHDVVVQAFAHLVARNPTRPLALLCVCDKGENGGFPIQEIFVRELSSLNIPVQNHINKLMISQNPLTYTDELVNELYCMSDVGITAAEGEGFGLCQFEAMGVGIPQVVPNIGGFKDFCTKDNSMIVDPKWRQYLPFVLSGVGGVAELVSHIDLMKAAEQYVFDSELRQRHGKAAMETVRKYNWADEVAKLAQIIETI